jgi:hypothetical protein
MTTLTCYRCGNIYEGIQGKDTYCPKCTVEMNVEPKEKKYKDYFALFKVFFPL